MFMSSVVASFCVLTRYERALFTSPLHARVSVCRQKQPTNMWVSNLLGRIQTCKYDISLYISNVQCRGVTWEA